MDKFENFCRTKGDVELCVIAAYPTEEGALHVAFEAYEPAKEKALTVVATIDPSTLAVDVVAEIEGFALSYRTNGRWHGVLQREGIAEVRGGTLSITPLKLPDHRQHVTNSEPGRLRGLALDGETPLVFGTKASDRYIIDGFVARLDNGGLEFILETSNAGVSTPEAQHEGDINAVLVSHTGAIVAGGSAMIGDAAPYSRSLFRGRTGAFEIVPIPFGEIHSLCESSDGTILVGARSGAGMITPGGEVTALEGIDGSARWVRAVVEFHGASWWLVESRDELVIAKHTGARLARAARTKTQPLRHRHTYFEAPWSSMRASQSLLVVSNRERLHLFDGAKWSQLALQRDAKKLVKRLPAGMK